MTLLVDMGNTRLKWAVHAKDAGLQSHACAWRSLQDDAALQAVFAPGAKGRNVLVASVLDASRQVRVRNALQQCGAESVQFIRTPGQGCGIRNAYPESERLGVDRFLGMVAAYHAGCAPCVVVSAGTALTLDALASDGRHLGGLIAPGPRLMQEALHAAAARLPESQVVTVVDCADNTDEAMASGCWQAAIALIERFHARMTGPLGAPPEVVLGGGDAKILAGHLARPVSLHLDAVLQGLAVWAEHENAQS